MTAIRGQISTQTMIDRIRDRIGEWRLNDQINPMFTGYVDSLPKLLDAINTADIEVCGLLKETKQVIVFVPKGQTEIYLRSSYYGRGKDVVAIRDKDLPDIQMAILLNTSFAVDASGLRSSYIFRHSSYPVGIIDGGQRHELVSFDRMQQATACKSHFNQGLPTAYYEAARGRVVLSQKPGSDCWFTFEAHVLPEEFEYDTCENACNKYKILTPAYAKSLLTQQVLMQLLPHGTKLREVVEADSEREKRRVLARIPQNPTVLRVDPYF